MKRKTIWNYALTLHSIYAFNSLLLPIILSCFMMHFCKTTYNKKGHPHESWPKHKMSMQEAYQPFQLLKKKKELIMHIWVMIGSPNIFTIGEYQRLNGVVMYIWCELIFKQANFLLFLSTQLIQVFDIFTVLFGISWVGKLLGTPGVH
jgi:hypothetical protein